MQTAAQITDNYRAVRAAAWDVAEDAAWWDAAWMAVRPVVWVAAWAAPRNAASDAAEADQERIFLAWLDKMEKTDE